jgi:hypothetical protein
LRRSLAGGLPFRLLSPMNMDGFPGHVNRNQRHRSDEDDANRFATSQPLSPHAAVGASRRNGRSPWLIAAALKVPPFELERALGTGGLPSDKDLNFR